MINIVVFSNSVVDIESTTYYIDNREDMIGFIKDLLSKAYYSGERICLESADIDVDKGKVNFIEIERW